MRQIILAFLFLVCAAAVHGQDRRIRVKDAATGVPVPFAAIRLGTSGQGLIADLDGLATLPASLQDGFIEVSALGYQSSRLNAATDTIIYLRAKKESLGEIVVKPDYDKLRHIIREAVKRRDAHNPERYDWYRCKVYYKMLADAAPRGESWRTDTAKDARELAAFLERQHLLVTETYSRRTYKRPQKLQEEVLATRFSGFKSPLFTSLVTDVLPFHCYTDYLTLNGRDFRNPISAGSGSWFTFNLRDELLQGGDTTWIISFFPKKAGEGLRGQVYITSKDFAVTHLIAAYKDTTLGSSIRVEQRYTEVSGKWFPQQLNYVWQIASGKKRDTSEGVITLQGTSRIDSVSFEEEGRYRFDKRHTVKLAPAAAIVSDSAWQAFRPETLDKKEVRTYVFMDSLMTAVHADRYLPYLSKLAEAKVPLGPIDINLDRLYRYNSYEGHRLGLGLQTNERISKHFSLGAWAGYGFKDVAWKWGGFAEAYLDAYKETSIRIAYEHDLREPGRVLLSPELDNNYLRNYLITRADAYDAYTLCLKRPFGYLSTELSLRHEEVSPKYDYSWNWEGRSASAYTADEASLRLRYAFAERSAPLFGRYLSTGSRFPILYAKATYGMMNIGGSQLSYVQATGALSWQKHIARIGQERWLLEGGKLWSDAPLPSGKLFAAPGLRNDNSHLYIFGGLQTVYLYSFYTDAFVFGAWRHDFDWRFYKAQFGKGGSMPGLSLAYNGYWGTLAHPAAQSGIAFSVPSGGYHEGGVLVRDIIRIQYLHLYYIGLTAAYFYPLQPAGADAGTYALGLNVSL